MIDPNELLKEIDIALGDMAVKMTHGSYVELAHYKYDAGYYKALTEMRDLVLKVSAKEDED